MRGSVSSSGAAAASARGAAGQPFVGPSSPAGPPLLLRQIRSSSSTAPPLAVELRGDSAATASSAGLPPSSSVLVPLGCRRRITSSRRSSLLGVAPQLCSLCRQAEFDAAPGGAAAPRTELGCGPLAARRADLGADPGDAVDGDRAEQAVIVSAHLLAAAVRLAAGGNTPGELRHEPELPAG